MRRDLFRRGTYCSVDAHRAAPLRFLMRTLDTLLTIRERPVLVERAVRSALVEAMRWRLGGGAAPNRSAFGFAAVAAVRQAAAPVGVAAAVRLELATVTERAAIRFYSSLLGMRLMSVPARQITCAPGISPGTDVAVRDRANHLHLIALTALAWPLEIGELVSRLADESGFPPQDRLAPLQIHVYSLRTGVRHQYRRIPGPALRALARSA